MISENTIVFGKPRFSKKEINSVIKTLKTGWVGTGKKTLEFEKKFLEYKKSKYGVALNSCTSAIHLSLILSRIKKGDEVIVTSLTFCSTVNAIVNIGAIPVLIDINLDNLQINENLIERKITKKTKAIIVVHAHGYPSEMKKIMKLKKKYSLKLIEDCAHAIETQFYNKHTGTFGDFGCFSFYSTKNITTVEGGMLICKNKADATKARMLSLHGMTKDAFKRFSKKKYIHYDVLFPGFKYNLTDLNASIGIEQLKDIEKKYLKRKIIWKRYQKAFKNTNFITPINNSSKIKHAYHLYFLRLKNNFNLTRDDVMTKLHELGVGTGLHYQAIPDLSFYKKKFLRNENDFQNSIIFGRMSFSIPLTPYLKESEINKIIKSVLYINKLLKTKK